ncbi:MAG TPA: tRNA (guanosine(37)-N1)-methyltransferase TrmD [Halanaerobiaceae bacterium]|jgi:tRNA (guanine37-N1)-methyltransferase|nr:tRNA (guanosine(37)-N1)-methyltransferase TrmD [Bacillota bacterium]HHU93284.1 tRNA (guanosine(37)-N1)-methyltransferase TrmD [Halanaerobiaceae bacterium]HOA40293.1 tRNA (guanosine(37)-N1)-methyltransferase TrmD [Halanaerobiales bacterium]HPZ62339.1 tRNA (guanosine(37)-N1)-methyltransferase TrmD [Halanaerobiales bacterium]HQD03185.1 tRNA (guanosine(37)-N1)-methyltransferase TrmD [Halanaerobiales bacterium]
MFFDILTLFPEMFTGPFDESIIKRAREKGIIEINLINIRDYTTDKHNTADDTPYGGGAGMVMKVEPIYRAWQDLHKKRGEVPVIMLSPQGRPLDQELVKDLSQEQGLILLCGHYEGIDERVKDLIVTDEISIGDYVLTGGELAAMVVVDAVARMIPGVLGDQESMIEDSFYNGLLDYPDYTRPREFMGLEVPEVLLSGNHGAIERWRRKEALKRTYLRRPDLLQKKILSKEELNLLEEIKQEIEGGKNG